MLPAGLSRRQFLQSTGAAAASLACWSELAPAAPRSANEKLNIGVIGVANRGRANLTAVASENIAALCDVDQQYLGEAHKQFPKATKYVDWRKMLEDKSLDAVVVSTPDHTHAVAAAAALRSGRHVYCEKPLAHTIRETRTLARLAEETGLATQLGNQEHASDRLRTVVELVRSGGLGEVREIVCWSAKKDARFAPGDRPQASTPVPSSLNWDLWLGPAPRRPYHPTAYHPRDWRGWWDFGEGNFGDMACHIMDTPFWALELDHPTRIEAEGPPVHPESAPPWLIVRYEFPSPHGRPPVKLSWHDGTHAPPQDLFPHVTLPGQGSYFIGSKAELLFPHVRGEIQMFVNKERVPLEAPEQRLPRPESQHVEWISACKTGSETYSGFQYGSRLTEAALAGIIAYRTGKKLEWDSEKMQATNCPEAAELVHREYRKGWEL